ncbi:TcaA NTF2-like domain-containing protein [Rossellomorea sp. LjRoot5]|uniref:TcaA NTF2-like domain-containing protein n=1 Tax=Rossellomorea sp. LjRoot5 TaxID=3342331 RepID=UPI003ED0B4D7
MKFCTSCGKKIEGNTPHCTGCGANIKGKETLNKKETSIPSFSTLTLKSKIIIGAALLFFITCISLYKVGDSLTNKANLLTDFEEYLETGNVDELVSILDSRKDSEKVTKKNVQALLTYLEENPDQKESMITQLHNNVKTADAHTVKANDDLESLDQLITFEKRGKKFLIYDNYDFIMESDPMTVYSNYNDLRYYVNGKEIKPESGEGDSVNFGTFIPGTYKVKAVLTSDFVELEKEVDIQHVGPTDTDLFFDIDYTTIHTNSEGASVWVNGKDTGIKTTEDNTAEIGPILTDGSMEVQVKKDMPFGTVQSDVLAIDDDVLDAPLALSDKQKDQAKEGLKQYFLNLSKALAYQDEKYLKEESNEVSPFVSSSFEELAGDDWKTFGYITGLEVDSKAIYLEKVDGEWMATLPVHAEWMQDYVYSGDPISLTKESVMSNYSLSYAPKSKKWSVASWSSAWDFDESNAQKIDIDTAALKKQMETAPAFSNISQKQVSDDVESFVESFISNGVQAYNNRDFSILSDDIDSSSAYSKTVKDYIDHLEKKGITEDLVNVEIVKVEPLEDGSYYVYTSEEYNIYYNDNTGKYKAFEGKYKITSTDDGLKMYDLVSTEEVDSRDL